MSHNALFPAPTPVRWTTPTAVASVDPVTSMIAAIRATGLRIVPNAQPGRGVVLCEDLEGSRVLAATTPNWGWPVTRFVLNRVVAKATAEGASKILVFVSGMVSQDAVEQAESLDITLIFPTSGEAA